MDSRDPLRSTVGSPAIQNQGSQVPTNLLSHSSKASNRLELSDLVYSYPQIGPGIQAGISQKYEFQEQSASIEEAIVPGRYFPHQQWVITFMQHYSRLLLIFATGSGKTCAFGGSGDSYIQSFAEGVLDYIDMYVSSKRTNIQRVFVLVKNHLLKDNFRRQMACVCARSNRYQTEKYRKATSEQERYRAIIESLNRYFSLKTYHGFSKMILTLRNDYPDPKDFESAVIRTYSNCYFIIDEAQNLRIRDGPVLTEEARIKREEKKKDKIETYRNIHYVLQRILVIPRMAPHHFI